VFEDSRYGVQAGVNAGATVTGVEGEHNRQELLQFGASHTIKDYEEAMQLFFNQ
jgi:beta-phosphoglucomutase-like phosphatase (HAD superfamily)